MVCLLVAAYGCGGGGSNQNKDGAADGTDGNDAAKDVRTDGGDAGDTRADGTGDAADTRTDVAGDASGDARADATDGGGTDLAAPTCTDGIKNGDETGIDCGGRCGKCQAGDPCKVAADCQFELCLPNGTCAACITANDCPGVESECQHRTCTAGVCAAAMEAAGKVLDVQTTGDCKRRQCSADGKVTVVNDDTDLPDDKNACTNDMCTAGVVSHSNVAANTSCGGANHCDANGQCVGCSIPSDCAGTDTTCRTRTCSATGVCGFSFAAAGTKLTDPTSQDCKGMACDGQGNSQVVNDDTDVPIDNNPCTTDQCNSGTISHQPVASGTSCGGSNVCDGASKCVECLSVATCPGTDTECQMRTCISGVCGTKNQTAGTLLIGQTAKDCKKNQCDGMGSPVTVPDDNDVPVDNNPCTSDVCTLGTPSNPPASSRTACNGTSLCDGAGACVSCLIASDCPGDDTECHTRTCSPTGVCGVNNVAVGMPVGTQMSGDCKRNECDGAGNKISVNDDADKPVDGNACTTDVCTAGVPSNPLLGAGTSCGTNLICDSSGACVGCVMASDCPGTDTPCQLRTCVNNQCGVNNLPATTVLTQAAGDCHKDVCDGMGHKGSVVDDTDKPVDGNACTQDLCTMGVPSNPPEAANTPCGQGGSSFCNGLATGTGIGPACVACVTAGQCPGSDTECQVRTCSAAGVCGTSNTADGTPVMNQTTGDCKKNVCNNGQSVSTNDDTDVFVDGNACTQDLCNAGVRSNPALPPRTPCGGGNLCNGSATAPACVGCLAATDCSGPDVGCHLRACVNGACTFNDPPNGTLVTVAPPGDCQRSVCDGAGNTISIEDDSDVPTTTNQCVTVGCAGGSPATAPKAIDSACAQGGGTRCNGAGLCVECNVDSTCPAGSNECQQPACSGGTCGFTYVAVNTLLAAQTSNDCEDAVCDGAGGITSIANNGDVPLSDGNTCHGNSCVSGAPAHPFLSVGTTCTGSNGAKVCDANGTCVQCNNDADCGHAGESDCATNRCMAGVCQLVFAVAGTPATDTAPGDCHTNQCDGMGVSVPIVNVADTNDGIQCTADSCLGGVATHSPEPRGTSCTDGGGRTCDGAVSCVSTFMVVRLGDSTGSVPLTNAATAVSIEERRESDGFVLKTIPLPTAAAGTNRPFAISGVADSEGLLALSGDGRFVTLAGYAATPGTTSPTGGSIAKSSSSTNPRVIARVDVSGNVDTSTILGLTATTAFSGNNIRSAVTNVGTDFWAGGDGSGGVSPTRGAFYATLGASASTLIESATSSTRACAIFLSSSQPFSSQLYCTASSPGIFVIGSGLPTATAPAPILSMTAMDTAASFYSFAFLDLVGGDGIADTLYVADERTTASGGIQKWTLSNGTWNLVGTFNSGLTGVRGLAARAVSGGVVLIGTTAIVSASSPSSIGNSIIKFFDDGVTAPASASVTTLEAAVSGVTKVYRGVASAPHL